MTYSKDLKDRVIYYKNNTDLSIRQIATLLLISKSTVHRWINNISNKKSTETYIEKNKNILSFLKNSLNKNPFQTLEILQNKIKNKFKIDKSRQTISNYLKIIGFKYKRTHRKVYSTTLKQHFLNKKVFKKQIKNINKEDIICIDESCIDGNLYKKYGWCKFDKKLVSYIKRSKIPIKYSLIMAINSKGIIGYKLYKKKGINTELFKNFIENIVDNLEGKHLLMDNVKFHKSKVILEIIKESKNEVLFIPPYSPEFNPIEEVFSEMKSFIRNNININFNNFDKKIKTLLDKFIKKKIDLKNYYNHAFD